MDQIAQLQLDAGLGLQIFAAGLARPCSQCKKRPARRLTGAGGRMLCIPCDEARRDG